MGFGFTSFASAAFSDLGTQQFNVEVNVTGEELQKVLESFAGVEAGGSISVPIFEGPISIVLQNVFVEADGQVEVTGQDITSVLGNETVAFDTSVTLTGFDLNLVENSVGIEASGNISVPVFENPMSINLGNAIEEITQDIFPTGLEASLILNSVSVEGIAEVTLTGFGLNIVENSVGISAEGNVSIPVFESPMFMSLGNTNETGTGEVFPTGEELTANLDSVTVDILKEVDVVGAEATIFLNDVTFRIDSNVSLTGFSLNTGLGSINNSYGWNIVNIGTSVNYLNVTPVFLPPSDTYSQLATFNSPSLTDRTSDFVFAVDVQGFDATDYGVLYEYGAYVHGHAISLEAGGQLWASAFNSDSWQAAGQAYLKVDVSSYYNTAGTFYTTMNDSTGTFKLYFQPGGSNSGNQVVLLGTSTIGDTTNNWAGPDPCGIGTVNGAGMVNFGFTNYNANFTGTINQFRAWYQTSAPIPFQGIEPGVSWNVVDTGTPVVYTEVAA
jgi:hypothetical protein